jgi:hypothetical protein
MRPMCIAGEGCARRPNLCITGNAFARRPRSLMRPVCIAGEGFARRRDLCISRRCARGPDQSKSKIVFPS